MLICAQANVLVSLHLFHIFSCHICSKINPFDWTLRGSITGSRYSNPMIRPQTLFVSCLGFLWAPALPAVPTPPRSCRLPEAPGWRATSRKRQDPSPWSNKSVEVNSLDFLPYLDPVLLIEYLEWRALEPEGLTCRPSPIHGQWVRLGWSQINTELRDWQMPDEWRPGKNHRHLLQSYLQCFSRWPGLLICK